MGENTGFWATALFVAAYFLFLRRAGLRDRKSLPELALVHVAFDR